jgi:hypothetical protein
MTSSSGFGFHFCRQSFDGYDLYGFSFFHERIAGRTPIFAFHKNFSAARIDRAKRVHRFSRHRFFADPNRQTLRAESFAYDKREERLNLVGHPPD